MKVGKTREEGERRGQEAGLQEERREKKAGGTMGWGKEWEGGMGLDVGCIKWRNERECYREGHEKKRLFAPPQSFLS